MRPRALLAMVLCLCLGGGTAPVGAEILRPWSGSPKPSFALKELNGGARGLDQHRGQVVLVHFFATWCEPCIPEMTSLRAMMEKQADNRVAVLAIDVAEVEDRVRRFFERLPVNFPILLDGDRAVTKAWQVHGLPTTYILDGTLTPRFVVEGAVDWTKVEVMRLIDGLTSRTDIQLENSMFHKGG